MREGGAKREDYFQLPKITASEDEPEPDSKESAAPKTGKKGDAKQVSISDL